MSLTRKLVVGSVWSVGMRWTIRLVGIFSIAILARLLTQEDFGLVAMSVAVTGLTLALFQLGIDFAVIRERELTEQFLHTAWTLRLVQAGLAALVVALLAPIAPIYFSDPRITVILWVGAVTLFLQGLENIGIVLYRRDLDFRSDFTFNVVSRIGGTAITITLAYLLRSYWALVLGTLGVAVLRVGLSYAMHAFRPRWSLADVERIWSFSKWMVVNAVMDYLRNQGDRFVLGGLTTAGNLGLYTVSREIGEMPAAEIAMPVSRTLMPAFATLVGEPRRLEAGVVRSLAAISAATAPLCFGLAAVAHEVVAVFLGSNWSDAAPLVAVTCFSGAVIPVFSVLGNVLIVAGYERQLAGAHVVQTTVILVSVAVGYQFGGVFYAAIGILLGQLLAVGGFGTVAVGLLGLRAWAVLGAVLRPVLCACGMYAALVWLPLDWHEAVWVRLVEKCVLGGLIFTSGLLLSWVLVGRPDGLEKLSFEFAGRHPRLRRLMGRLKALQ